jgi:ribosome-binding factor A
VGVLGDAEQQRKSLDGLGQAAGFVRRELGKRIRLRHIPQLSFHHDAGLEATDRVAKLLREIEESGEPEAE